MLTKSISPQTSHGRGISLGCNFPVHYVFNAEQTRNLVVGTFRGADEGYRNVQDGNASKVSGQYERIRPDPAITSTVGSALERHGTNIRMMFSRLCERYASRVEKLLWGKKRRASRAREHQRKCFDGVPSYFQYKARTMGGFTWRETRELRHCPSISIAPIYLLFNW